MPVSTRVQRPRHASRPLHRRVLGAIAAGTAALLGFGLVGGATYLQLTVGSLETHDVSSLLGPSSDSDDEPQESEPTDFAADTPINIVLIGTDERNGVNADIGGGSDIGGMRGDTTMVMHISADRSRIEVVSIPRDSRVRISDCKMYDGSVKKGWTAKFNVALANGGINGNRGEAAACVMRTITDLTGVDFNGHFMMVDFNGFQDMVDALDGIPMCIPHDMRSAKANLDLKAGAQTLDGETALAYARARTGTGLGDGSDLMRIERQQTLLTNTARKVLGTNLLVDVPELTQFVRAAAESVTLDNQLASVSNIVGLGYSLRDFDPKNLTFVTVPWHYAGDDSGDVLWKEAEAAAMWQSIVDDRPIVLPTDEPVNDEVPDPLTSPGAADPGAGSADAAQSEVPASNDTPSNETVKTESVDTASSTTSTEPTRETEEEILAGCTTA